MSAIISDGICLELTTRIPGSMERRRSHNRLLAMSLPRVSGRKSLRPSEARFCLPRSHNTGAQAIERAPWVAPDHETTTRSHAAARSIWPLECTVPGRIIVISAILLIRDPDGQLE